MATDADAGADGDSCGLWRRRGGGGGGNRCVTRCLNGIMPAVVVASYGLCCYAFYYHVCVLFLLRRERNASRAAFFIAFTSVVLILSLVAYFRLVITVWRNPDVVPLINGATKRRAADDLEAASSSPWPDQNPDSPGLEAFYSKDAFVCQPDGRPRWCPQCRQWKPDRAHHSNDLRRCVFKMDHVCPWSGGMISETTYKFFHQFNSYGLLLTACCLGMGAYCLARQPGEVDGWVVALVVISTFYFVLQLGMCLVGFQSLLFNTTHIEVIKRGQRVFLAVRIPRDTPMTDKFRTIVYPLQIGGDDARPSGDTDSASMRDRRAVRKFAIIQLESRENPWDMGPAANWRSVMDERVIDWLLPLRKPPCCRHDSMEAEYPMTVSLAKLRKRHGLPELGAEANGGMELQHVATR